ncbi:hypothetical protein [Glutamicibacter protophormiae]|uniref:hypothetical protein n=1 Tax=Glutamicibacter protophormiae TaxID=37930 RepID=UPI0033205F12
MSELATIRRNMEIRRTAFERAIADRELLENAKVPTVTIRCEHHKNGKFPKLAEALVYKGVLYFISRIEWRPDDQTTRRPWTTEHFFGVGSRENSSFWHSAMTDDDFLRRCIEEQGSAPQVTGERWISKAEHWIRYAMPLANLQDFPALGLWTRCKDHPQHATEINPISIIEALR